MTADLKEMIDGLLKEGAFGVTLQTGKPVVAYFASGRRTIPGSDAFKEDISALLHGLLSSREMRQFWNEGVIHFQHTFGDDIELLGGARTREDSTRVELRRTAPIKTVHPPATLAYGASGVD